MDAMSNENESGLADRRTVLKTIGGVAGAAAVGGGGIVALGGGVAAASVNVTAGMASISNDDGDVREVFIDPQLRVSWRDLDDAVGAVSIFVEAKRRDDDSGPNGGYWPLHRSEPVLLAEDTPGMSHSKPGTTGHFNTSRFSNLSTNRADGDGWGGATDENGRLKIADAEAGVPDYSGSSEGYLQGANVSGATMPDGEPLVNGEYGAASTVGPFEATTEGAEETIVDLRYTVQLLELSLGHFEMITGYDAVGKTDGTIGSVRDKLEEIHDATSEEWDSAVLDNADHLSNVQPEDITVIAVNNAGNYTTDPNETISWETNQKYLAMANGDDYDVPDFHTSRHNADVRAYSSDQGGHPAVMVAEPAFRVKVTNEVADDDVQTAEGESNTGVQ